MASNGWLQIALFGLIAIAITRPFGGYMTRVFGGERTFLIPLLRPVERFVYCGCGEACGIGTFCGDITRRTLYSLLPISVVLSLLFGWQGVPQNLSAYVDATTLDGARQTIAQGPVASQEVIKVLGTNGGGFFN